MLCMGGWATSGWMDATSGWMDATSGWMDATSGWVDATSGWMDATSGWMLCMTQAYCTGCIQRLLHASIHVSIDNL